MLAATRRMLGLDHFRVPYRILEGRPNDRLERVESQPNGPALVWPRPHGEQSPSAAHILGPQDDVGIPVFARVVPDRLAQDLLSGGDWTRNHEIVTADGQHLGSIWRAADGSAFLPFDPDELVGAYWSESYAAISSPGASRWLKHAAMRTYYGLRPALPRPAQIWLRRRFARVQARSTFPRWPVESALDDFYRLLFSLLSDIAGAAIPSIAPWPDGYTWALVLTHDVEQAEGYAATGSVLELERRYGVRSAWFYVPRRYAIDSKDLSALKAEGLEVGVHGLYHDGRDLSTLERLRERLPGIREAADSWGATGFRSPALHRRWEWMPMLGFDYDTSFPDTDPYEPMPGGCCSWLPFFIGDLVELPVTLPQDHTLFVILRQDDEAIWVEKTELLRARGGMALLDTHPDYLVDPTIFRAYEGLLKRYSGDPEVWQALPGEVSDWWRRRAASRLEYRNGEWQIVGPAAAQGRIELIDGRGLVPEDRSRPG
jgi:hypothetical protein